MMKLLTIFFVLLIAASTSDAGRTNRRRRGGGKKKIDPDVQALVNNIWNLDKNRAKYGEDYQLCYQGQLDRGDRGDKAPNPLICKMNPAVLEKPTFKAFAALMDNYNRNEGKAEDITQQEIDENNKFLDLVVKSDAMKAVHALLVKKKKASSDPAQFRKKLYTLWFGPYGRKASTGILDSSGFEHVFMGEINGRKHNIGGFHNWIHMYKEEKAGNLNYMGYLKKSDNPLIFNFRFTWYNTLKPLGSSFFGTSPEFEMSLYTAIYMMGYTHANINVNGLKLLITCWPINHNQNIGTCYPSIM